MVRKRDDTPAQDVVITTRVRGPVADLSSIRYLRFYMPGEGALHYFASGHERARPQREVPLASVLEWLNAAGLPELPTPTIEGLRAYLCPLTIPRYEEITPVRDLPSAILHRLLGPAETAAKNFAGMMHTIANVCDRHSGTTDFQDGPDYRVRMERTFQFIEAARGLAEILPPKPPREVKWWHDDARWIASFLVEMGRSLDIDIGLTRGDRTGARFIAAALHGLNIARVTPAAVAKEIRRAADN